MAIEWTTVTNLINLGSSPNSGDGDSIRLAFTKINNNFLALFTATSDITTATYTTIGLVKPGEGLAISPDGALSVTGDCSTSTVNILDDNDSPAVEIISRSGAFTLPSNTLTSISLFSFDTTLYRNAMIDIVANDLTEPSIDHASNYFVTWINDSANVVGLSPVSIKDNGTTKTALWDLKDVVLENNLATVRIYNMQGNPPPLHDYTWRAKITLFRL